MRYPEYLTLYVDRLMISPEGGIKALLNDDTPLAALLNSHPARGSDAGDMYRALLLSLVRSGYSSGLLRAEHVGIDVKGAKSGRPRPKVKASPYLASLATWTQREHEAVLAYVKEVWPYVGDVVEQLPNNRSWAMQLSYSQHAYGVMADGLYGRLVKRAVQAAWESQESLSQLPVATYAAILYGRLVDLFDGLPSSKAMHRRLHLVAALVALSVAMSRCLNMHVPGLLGAIHARALLQKEAGRPMATGLAPLPLRTFLFTRTWAFTRTERFFFFAACAEAALAHTLDGSMEDFRVMSPELPPASRAELYPAFAPYVMETDGLPPMFVPAIIDGVSQALWLRRHRDVPMLPTVERVMRGDVNGNDLFASEVSRFFRMQPQWGSAPVEWRLEKGRYYADGESEALPSHATLELLKRLVSRQDFSFVPTGSEYAGGIMDKVPEWHARMAHAARAARVKAEDEEFEARLSTIRVMANRDIRREMFRQLWEELHAKGKLEQYRGRLSAFFDAVIGDEFLPDPLLDGRGEERDTDVMLERPVSPAGEQGYTDVISGQSVERVDDVDEEAELQRLIARFQQGLAEERPVSPAGEGRYTDVTEERSVEPVDIADDSMDEIRAGLLRAIEEGRRAAQELQVEARAGGEGAAGDAGIVPGLSPMPEWLRRN